MSFFNDIGDSFYKSFIYDDRYLYFLEGIKNTLIIAFFAVLIGIFLGMIISLIKDYNKDINYINIHMEPREDNGK